MTNSVRRNGKSRRAKAIAGEAREDQHAGGLAERDDGAVEQPAQRQAVAEDRGVILQRVRAVQRGLAVPDQLGIVLERQQQRPDQRREHDRRAEQQCPPSRAGVSRPRRSSAAIARRRCSARRPILGERHREDDQEQDFGRGARIAELPPAERAFRTGTAPRFATRRSGRRRSAIATGRTSAAARPSAASRPARSSAAATAR